MNAFMCMTGTHNSVFVCPEICRQTSRLAFVNVNGPFPLITSVLASIARPTIGNSEANDEPLLILIKTFMVRIYAEY